MATTETLPSWDLEHLLDGAEVAAAEAGSDAERVDALLDEADSLAARFAAEHEGRVAEFDASGLRDAMLELARISELVGRAGNYAQLAFSADTADPETGALMQRVTERATQVQTRLIFFELEWVALDDDRAAELLADDSVEPALRRAHLRDPRRGAGDRRTVAARRGALAPARPRPRPSSQHRRGRDVGARAGIADPRLRLQHPAPGQGDHRPPARVPQLGRGAKPLQRGLRRVGPGPGRRRPEPLRARPPLVPGEGAPARHREARRLRPDGERLH